jgi:hypothetical protein
MNGYTKIIAPGINQEKNAQMSFSRATIFRHVRANDIVCSSRMLHWIDKFECLIMAFSWVFALLPCVFYQFNDAQRCESFGDDVSVKA